MKRPEEEWIGHRMPELQIIPDDLWERVKDRRERAMMKGAKIRASLKGHGGRGPKYLFSSLLKCGTCGGNMVITGGQDW